MWMKVKKLHTDAIIPTRAHDTDAGLDVYTLDNEIIAAGGDKVIRTGIAIAIPDNWVAIVKEKSGRAIKDKITIGACVIDSGYRGELLIHLISNRPKTGIIYYDNIYAGEAIAQLILIPCWCGQPEEVEELDETERGDGKFGSTGLRKNLDTEDGKKIGKV